MSIPAPLTAFAASLRNFAAACPSATEQFQQLLQDKSALHNASSFSALHAIMRFLSAKLMHPCSCTLALSALAIIALTAANLAPSIPAPSAFRAVADGRWTPQYRLNWAYSDAIDYLYFEVARNCSDGRTVFIRVDDKSMTDYFDIKSLRCTYAVRAVSIASASPFSVSVTVGFGGLPSAPYSIESVLPTKANTLQVSPRICFFEMRSSHNASKLFRCAIQL